MALTPSLPSYARPAKRKATGGRISDAIEADRNAPHPSAADLARFFGQQKPSATVNPVDANLARLGAALRGSAPPPPDPFLTADDTASQALELSDWTKYLGDLDQQVQEFDIQAGLQRGDVERQTTRNLDATDWNTAARGLQASSIKDRGKADIVAQKDRALGAIDQQRALTVGRATGERQRFQTDINPKLQAKWAERARGNAEAVADQQQPVVPSNEDLARFFGQGQPPPAAASGAPKPVVKGGKFYHVYGHGTPNERWVYVRPAGR